ncbi:MAG: magnesium/cobalt transporter CorA [Nanoarchaeota archaeon]|nr:magnesium/cobalt transporter CorA [Nanoarchaeota archaeon]
MAKKTRKKKSTRSKYRFVMPAAQTIPKVKISIIDYDEKRFLEKEAKTIEECVPFRDPKTVTWINVDGVHDLQTIEMMGSYFGIHPLILEDITQTDQRPKIEVFEDHIFILLKMLMFDPAKKTITSEQVSVLLGDNFVISFQENKAGDVLEPIRERIRTSKGRIRKLKADYLLYTILDAVVDHYFVVLEHIGEHIETLEEKLITHPTTETLQALYSFKRELFTLSKSVWPLREVINKLQRGETDLINDATEIYFKDVYDHTIQTIETVETYRDIISGMLDVYLSSVSNKMNEIMKVLTIIATIFIPLTFITGIYGMNFVHMPEIEWEWGYTMVWTVIIVSAIFMLYYFRKKNWL